MRFRRRRPVLDGLLKPRLRFRQRPLLLQDRAEHVVGVGVVRFARERLAELLHGLFRRGRFARGRPPA